jgi:hypothetical protein
MTARTHDTMADFSGVRQFGSQKTTDRDRRDKGDHRPNNLAPGDRTDRPEYADTPHAAIPKRSAHLDRNDEENSAPPMLVPAYGSLHRYTREQRPLIGRCGRRRRETELVDGRRSSGSARPQAVNSAAWFPSITADIARRDSALPPRSVMQARAARSRLEPATASARGAVRYATPFLPPRSWVTRIREPNGEPTQAGARRHQAISSDYYPS